jgi:hypothetical protein
MNEERDTPRSRIPFVTGNCPLSKSNEIRSRAALSSIAAAKDRLRVICWKSGSEERTQEDTMNPMRRSPSKLVEI